MCCTDIRRHSGQPTSAGAAHATRRLHECVTPPHTDTLGARLLADLHLHAWPQSTHPVSLATQHLSTIVVVLIA